MKWKTNKQPTLIFVWQSYTETRLTGRSGCKCRSLVIWGWNSSLNLLWDYYRKKALVWILFKLSFFNYWSMSYILLLSTMFLLCRLYHFPYISNYLRHLMSPVAKWDWEVSPLVKCLLGVEQKTVGNLSARWQQAWSRPPVALPAARPSARPSVRQRTSHPDWDRDNAVRWRLSAPNICDSHQGKRPDMQTLI